ncbi:hypothetical protein SAMD00023353_0101770 [Rosellinia necatrix]|uniref:2EXR domain-containing protein n=1 Tax=Rosellinia necatrix TaxID=77044 RepID=A0A1S7UHK3_ROSNE|nr:hypothetical protein SAMD00023353_0101770 [Rosellinia necatrix]
MEESQRSSELNAREEATRIIKGKQQQQPELNNEAKTLGTFTCFPLLPPELRLMIWDIAVLSIPDVPELVIQDGSSFHPRKRGPPPMLVRTGFAAAMHVNREARATAMRRGCFTYAEVPAPPVPPGARRRGADRGTRKLSVPVRAFRPELDVLFLPWEGWRSFFLLRELYHDDGGGDEDDDWLASLQHLAVDACLSRNMAVLVRQLPLFRSLRTLTVVLPTSETPVKTASMVYLPGPPLPRCALGPYPSHAIHHPALSACLQDVADGTWRAAVEALRAVADQNGGDDDDDDDSEDGRYRAALKRHMDFERKRVKFVIRGKVLLVYGDSDGRRGFSERGKDKATQVVLPIQ